MHKEFLDLIPTRYLCPYCGEWHAWEYDLSLNMCDYDEKVIHDCVNAPNGTDRGRYKLWFERGHCYYSISSMCGRAGFNINDDILISNIIENEESPIVTFEVPFSCGCQVSASTCADCPTSSICNPLRLVCDNDSYDIIIKLGFEFNQEDYETISKVFQQAREKRDNKLNQLKEENVMAMRLFNHKIEFGANTDKNIVSTLMGIAVNTGGSWRIYDKEKGKITDIGNLQLGNLPIFLMPTTRLAVGDMIKDAGEYYFVVETEKSKMKTLCAKTGEIKMIVPIEDILGRSVYTKVIALSDSLDIGKDFDLKDLAIMSAMCGGTENGAQMGQILPLMLFKDNVGRSSDDMIKMMCMSSMMTSPSDGNVQMNQMLPLMLLRKDSDDSGDMMKMMAVSSMMGGNQEGAGNPFMGYMMLDMLKDKKNTTPNNN